MYGTCLPAGRSEVKLEQIRTFNWTAICRLVLLAVLVMLYLTWVLERQPNLAERLIAFPDLQRDCRISRTSCSIAC